MILLLLVSAFLIFGFLIVLWFVFEYNRFVRMNNAIQSTFNQIRVAMKKRLDKIGKLVETSKSYIKYEKTIFTDVAKIRSQPMKTPADLNKLGNKLGTLLGNIKVAVEAYPNLKSDQTVLKLMNEIDEIEDEVGRLRYLYNDQVQMFNNMVQMVPSNIVAGLLNYTMKDYLKFGQNIEQPPDTKVF